MNRQFQECSRSMRDSNKIARRTLKHINRSYEDRLICLRVLLAILLESQEELSNISIALMKTDDFMIQSIVKKFNYGDNGLQ